MERFKSDFEIELIKCKMCYKRFLIESNLHLTLYHDKHFSPGKNFIAAQSAQTSMLKKIV